jgi:hypothetical protein
VAPPSSPHRPKVALVLGAGWSAAAGYPLAAELLSGPIHVGTSRSATRVHAVLSAFQAWASTQTTPWTETFLALVREGKISQTPDPNVPTLFDDLGGPPLPWSWAVETVMLRIAAPTPPAQSSWEAQWVGVLPTRDSYRVRYGGQLGSPTRSRVHVEFVRTLLAQTDLIGVVTTNYDTLAERTLRHRGMKMTPEPGFYYAGLPQPQWAQGSSSWDYYNEEQPANNAIEISGTIPLCKLHGSLSWGLTGHTIGIWRDMRLSYREGGLAAIVAPTPDKTVEPWLAPVWDAALTILAEADLWIVVGYSLPPYDQTVRDFFAEAAGRGKVKSVRIHDPAAKELKATWETAVGVNVTAAPGLPKVEEPGRPIVPRWPPARPDWA